MATLYENHTTENLTKGDPYGTLWDSQTFTPSVTHTITSVKLKQYRTGSPGTMTVSIRATSSHKPTGADLCSGTIDGNGFPTSLGTAVYQEITLGAGTLLTADIEYAIVIRCPDGNTTNRLNTRGSGSDAYAGGQRNYSSNSGSSWTAETATDFVFEEYGNPVGWSNIAKLKGVSSANIAKVNGVAVAGISKVNGTAV
jgi:hypothetical protein